MILVLLIIFLSINLRKINLKFRILSQNLSLYSENFREYRSPKNSKPDFSSGRLNDWKK